MLYKLRPAGAEDAEFLFGLYSSTRASELAAWGWEPAQQAAFLRMQHLAQARHYSLAFPQARHDLVIYEQIPVGRILVWPGPDAFTLVDIALLPEYRSRGLGTALLKDLQKEAQQSQRPVQLKVFRGNPAARLYERLGFKFLKEEEDSPYLSLEWSASQPA